jgi:crotonobetainyl-CoA:carnitine CoA-transferase CaiB-like acyl-CoA transferase
LCQLLERDDLSARQYEPAAGEDLAAVIAARPLAEWLELFDGEDVCVGPVYTLEEAAAEFGT